MRKPIDGCSVYEVSDCGQVRNAYTDHVLVPQANKCGVPYLCVSMRADNGRRVRRSIHRLVAAAFCLRRPGCEIVRHLNSDHIDNRAENLAWGTASENVRDSQRNKGVPRGWRYKRMSPLEARAIVALGSLGASVHLISTAFGRDQKSVRMQIKRQKSIAA